MNPMSDLTKQSELKNCPFCGGKPRFDPEHNPEGFLQTVCCTQCGSEAGTAVIWNTRPASAGVREALEKIDIALKAFNEIRLDWSDPRSDIDTGRDALKAAITLLSDHGVQKSAGIEPSPGAERAESEIAIIREVASLFSLIEDESDADDGADVFRHDGSAISYGAVRKAHSLLSKTLTEGEKRSIATKQSTDPEGNSRTETAYRESRPSVPSDGFNCVYLYEDGHEVGFLSGPQDDPAVITRAKHWASAAPADPDMPDLRLCSFNYLAAEMRRRGATVTPAPHGGDFANG